MPPAQLHPLVPRIERQHRIVDELRACAPRPVRVVELATALGVSNRSIERDIRLLRDAGLPIVSSRGPRGGYVLDVATSRVQVELTLGEIAVLVASLVAMGPLASAAAQSALDKLVGTLNLAREPRQQGVRRAGGSARSSAAR